jgi:hypothetical protein
MKMPLIFVTAATLGVMVLGPSAQAQSSLNASARTSGEVVGGSTEAAVLLVATGVTVTAGTAVAVTGTAAAIMTADGEVFEDSMELAARIASAPFNTGEPLSIDDDVIIAAPPPHVPSDRRPAVTESE